MKIVVFDTETTGIPLADLSLDKQPYICQFAGALFDYNTNEGKIEKIAEIDQLLRPPVAIPFVCTEIHGINDDMVQNAPGFADFVNDLLELFHSADVAVAHNLAFDQKIIELELGRMGLSKSFLPEQLFDTMKVGRDLCQLPGRKDGSYKMPRLAELHYYLFEEGFENAHNAMADVMATAKCMWELMKRGLISPEEPMQNSLF